MVPAIAQWWSGMDIYLYLEEKEVGFFGHEKAICIMNHKGELDWVVSWVASDYFKVLQVCINSCITVLLLGNILTCS